MVGSTRRRLGIALLGGVAALPHAAWAQGTTAPVAAQPDAPLTAAGPAPSSEATPQSSAAVAPGDNGQIQEIIVSARRRNESIQTTPVAVTAISPAQLENKASLNITELQGAAPSVLITTQSTGAAAANISIRGIAFADVDKSFDPAVGVNVDGVYIGTSTGQLLDFFDIASIEILRGPQGTLFGRNTIAGVINIRRTRPTGEWGGKFEASWGDYNQIALRGVLNVPIVKDVFAAKLFEFHQQTSGFYRDAFTGHHLGRSNQENFGGAFLLTPSSKFDALLTLEQQDQDFQPYQGSLTQPGDVFCNFQPAGACGRNNTTDVYTVFPAAGYPYNGRYKARAATLEANWDLDFTKLTSVTSYRHSREYQREDFGTSGLYDAARFQTYHQFSQELRASGNLFRGFDYVVGGYYFESQYHLVQNTNVFGAFAGTQDTVGKSRSEAVFADLNWEFLPHFRLSGGGRYTHDHKENSLTSPVDAAASYGQGKFTPRVTLDWRPTSDYMLYASWSKGYRSGGFSGRGLTVQSATTPYQAETVTVYEVGAKSEFFDRKVALNLAAYYTDYRNIQQSTTVTSNTGIGNETLVVNAAGAKIKGVEGDLTARPLENLTLRASAGYTDSHFKNFLVDQPVFGVVRTFDLSAVNLIYAPKLTSSFNADYKIPLGERTSLNLSAGYRFITRYDQQIAADPATPIPAAGTIVVARNDPRLRSDRQNLVDASVSLVFPMGQGKAKGRVSVFGRNLLDDRGTATAFTVAAYPTLWGFSAAREPRIIGASFGFEF